MSLFQRIKKPFSEMAGEDTGQPERRAHAVGELLRRRREELHLDIDAVAAALRIKSVFLAAVEQGRTQDLPGPTYAIGFIRAYAHYLGLDGERVLDRYKAESSEVYARPDLSLPVPLGARSLPGGPILLVAAILALCGYGTWYYLSTGERSRPERVAAVPAELQQAARPTDNPIIQSAPPAAPDGAAARLTSGLVSTETAAAPPTASPSPANAGLVASPAAAASAPAPTPPVTPVAAPAGEPAAQPAAAVAPGDAVGKAAGQIEIRAVADCWIQVRSADDQIIFSRVLKAGDTYRVPRPGLLLRTGNAGALAVLVDGKAAPSLGGLGALRRNVELDPAALLAGTAIRG